MERIRAQDAAAATAELHEQIERLRGQARQQAAAAEAAQQRAAAAEARAAEAGQRATALQEEVHRRQSVHSESMDSVARLTVGRLGGSRL